MLVLKIIFFVFIFVVIYTYVGYGLLLWLLVKLKRRNNKSHDKANVNLPRVTLLIAAYNEEDIVAEKMANTLALNYPKDKLQVMWITDGTTDNTNARLDEYKGVKVLFEPKRQGKTAALNRAIDYVDTPIVIFTDANTMINSEAILEIVKCFEDEHVGCVAGEKRIAVKAEDNAAAGGEGIYWKYESTLKRLDSELYSAVGAAGELFGVRTKLFEKMENDTLLDDFIMSMRIAAKDYKIEYCADAYAIEGGSADMKEEGKRKVRIAAGGLQSIWRLRKLLNIFKYKTLSFQYISHRVLRWSLTPFMLFALVPVNVAIVALDSSNVLYWTILALQVIFYLLGFWGYALSKRNIKNKILYIPYYFLFMNVNVVYGISYLMKRRGGNGAWEKAKRA